MTYQPELMQIAESLAGLLPRLMRGLSPPDRSSAGGKDVIEELPFAQLPPLRALGEGPRAMSVLSRELGVSLSALTQIADRLERVRLVKRTAAADDRRVRCLQLTPRGQRVMRKRRDARLRSSVAVLEHLSPSERETGAPAMDTLVSACTRAQDNPLADRRLASGGSGNGRNHGRMTNKNSKSRASL